MQRLRRPSFTYLTGEFDVPKYEVNEKALVHARHLIDARRYVIRSR